METCSCGYFENESMCHGSLKSEYKYHGKEKICPLCHLPKFVLGEKDE